MKAFPLEQKLLTTSNVRKHDVYRTIMDEPTALVIILGLVTPQETHT